MSLALIKKWRATGLTVALLAVLVGCASQKPAEAPEVLTPLPQDMSTVRDPSDAEFTKTLQAYIKSKKGPAYSQYQFTRIDLDSDGRREGIAMLHTPHHFWCGMNGCSMIVFRAHDDSFTPISEIAPVRGPLTVSETTTNGWRDLVVRVSGRFYMDAKNVALRYDGTGYPAQPAFQPALMASNDLRGVQIFPW